jgi:hypothetical protein
MREYVVRYVHMRFASREKILSSLAIGAGVAGGVHWLRWYQADAAGYGFSQAIVRALFCCGGVLTVLMVISIKKYLAWRWFVAAFASASLALVWLIPLPVPEYIRLFERHHLQLTALAQQVAALPPSPAGRLPCQPVPESLQPLFFDYPRAHVCQTTFRHAGSDWTAVKFWLLDGFEFFYIPVPTQDKRGFCDSWDFVEIDENWFSCGRSLPHGLIGA